MQGDIKEVLTEKLAELLKDPEKTQDLLAKLELNLRNGSALLGRFADDVEAARETHKNFSGLIARVGISKEMLSGIISKFMEGRR